jgi:hypothetical protein
MQRRLAQAVFTMVSLTQDARQVFGADLNCSESMGSAAQPDADFGN